nr:MAG TPA: hypothetical protein [Caudoviricetes sp.]
MRPIKATILQLSKISLCTLLKRNSIGVMAKSE